MAPLWPFCPIPSPVSPWGCVPEHSWGSAQTCSSLQLCACRRTPQRALGCRGGTFLLIFPAFSVPVRWQSRRKTLCCASFSILGEQGDRGGPSWWQHPAPGGFCKPGSGSPLSFLCNLFVFGPSKNKQQDLAHVALPLNFPFPPRFAWWVGDKDHPSLLHANLGSCSQELSNLY